jgi:hypothetical protein
MAWCIPVTLGCCNQVQVEGECALWYDAKASGHKLSSHNETKLRGIGEWMMFGLGVRLLFVLRSKCWELYNN